MSDIELSETIQAPVELVWRALCDPVDVAQWDSEVAEALDAPPNYPQPGQTVRWRLRSGGGILIDRPFSVIPERRLGSDLRLGRVHYREVYQLESRPQSCRLSVSIDVRVGPPILGRLLARVWARNQARRSFQESLAGLRRFCETAR